MVKDLIGFSLILIGIVEIGNFFAHHGTNTPINDYNSHAFAGLILCVAGVYILKMKSPFIASWTKFK